MKNTIGNIFKKKTSNKLDDSFVLSKNWNEDIYNALIVKRNRLFFLLIVAMLIILASVCTIIIITTSKKFTPFIIAIEENTGKTKVLKELNKQSISSNEALAKYFIKKYVVARETYNPADNNYNERLIRLFSSKNVLVNYLGYIKNNDLTVKYGDDNTTYLTVRSWSKLDDSKYVLRFSISETSGQMNIFYKIAIVGITYKEMELTESQFNINPVGFTVTEYRIDDDNS